MTLLDGAFAKLGRADEHADTLKDSIQCWIDKKAYGFTAEDNLEGTQRCYYIEFSEIPDHTRWGAIIGDTVHNLRSCLDNIAWQAAGGDGVAPDNTEFPIFKDCLLYESSGRDKIRGIQEPAYRTIIENSQPWRNPNGFHLDELWIVHELDRVDKHRVVHPIMIPPLGVEGHADVTYVDSLPHPPPLIQQHDLRFEKRAKACTITASAPFVDMKVRTHLKVGFGIELAGLHLGGTKTILERLTQHVRGIAEQFRNAGL